jgi:tRNA threonylcarbamoyladenosine biosynthesis protein TsaB
VKAEVIDENSYKDLLDERSVIFLGNGAEKCKGIINHANATFLNNIDVSAVNMITLSQGQFRNNFFEDVAYFEPFYLKDFRATTPKKGLL